MECSRCYGRHSVWFSIVQRWEDSFKFIELHLGLNLFFLEESEIKDEKKIVWNFNKNNTKVKWKI